MLTCIPCLNTRGLIKGVTHQMRGLSLKAARVQRRAKSHKKEKSAAEAQERVEVEEHAWVAEAEPGVLITLVSLPNGGNHLKRIRFSEEHFDAWEAQRWWTDNCDKIMELYSIHRDNSPPTPLQSEDDFPIDSAEVDECNGPSSAWHTSHDSVHKSSSDIDSKAPEGESSMASAFGTDGEVGEMVVEEEPGIFVTFRSRLDGSKELLRVELSREMFGEVKARVWWEENKVRLQKQYT